MKKVILGFALISLAAGCSSSPTVRTSENDPDKVIARIDDLSSRPDWVSESEPFKIEKGEVRALGMTSIPGDNRIEAAYRIAENNAKAAIATAIEQRLEFILQNAEEGTGYDSTQARYIGAEAAKITTSSISIKNRYWEKVASTKDNGQRGTIYKIFTSVTMPEQDFKRAILDAIRKQQGKGGISKEFAKQVSNHWDSFVTGGEAKEAVHE